jgi:phosphoglycolate phosphatase
MICHAAIFDLDGTLLDTIEDLTDSMNAALAALGHPPRTIGECKRLVGDGIETFVLRALPEAERGNPESALRLREMMRAEYRLRSAVKTHPYPGIGTMLDALAARRIPLSILSNKPHASTLSVVGRFFPGRPFRAIFGAREGVPIKPDPAGALEIAGLLGLTPAAVLYLGDTDTDMRTAVAAGMFAVGALWGFRTEEELRLSGAQALAAAQREVEAMAASDVAAVTLPVFALLEQLFRPERAHRLRAILTGEVRIKAVVLAALRRAHADLQRHLPGWRGVPADLLTGHTAATKPWRALPSGEWTGVPPGSAAPPELAADFAQLLTSAYINVQRLRFPTQYNTQKQWEVATSDALAAVRTLREGYEAQPPLVPGGAWTIRAAPSAAARRRPATWW